VTLDDLKFLVRDLFQPADAGLVVLITLALGLWILDTYRTFFGMSAP
jgi:hypothetical protein